MITPIIINLEISSKPVATYRAVFLENIPLVSYISLNNTGLFQFTVEHNLIDYIRGMPLYNHLATRTVSNYYKDISQMYYLMGSFQKFNPITYIINEIQSIQLTMATKKIPTTDLTCQKGAAGIKGWIKNLTNIHPLIDTHIKKNNVDIFKYWKEYSDLIGTNTVLYNTDTTNIDISYWGETPNNMTNDILRTNMPFFAPHYIREGTRTKLDSNTVHLIQSANAKCTLNMSQNLVKSATRSSKPITGGEYTVERPNIGIPKAIGHSLQNDYYHWMIRVMPIIKLGGLKDCIMYCNEYYLYGDFTISALVNHLWPMKPYAKAEDHIIVKSAPQGIEETAPNALRRPGLYTDMAGNPVFEDTKELNEQPLYPMGNIL